MLDFSHTLLCSHMTQALHTTPQIDLSQEENHDQFLEGLSPMKNKQGFLFSAVGGL